MAEGRRQLKGAVDDDDSTPLQVRPQPLPPGLVHLQRHADHHLNPGRPYAALQPQAQSPRLPTGYPGMIPLALVPPLWFAVMNRRVPKTPSP